MEVIYFNMKQTFLTEKSSTLTQKIIIKPFEFSAQKSKRCAAHQSVCTVMGEEGAAAVGSKL